MVVVVDRVSFSGGGEEWEFVFIVSDGHPRGIIKISVSRRRDILATHVPLAGIASVRRFSSRDRG